MSKPFFYIVLIFLGFWSSNVNSQTYCTVPLPPLLKTVSVQPESGITEIKWTLSPSTDIAAYIIYSYKNGDAIPIDTLWNPIVSSYDYAGTAYKYFSASFVVAAYRLPGTTGISRRFGCPSELSNVLSTIFAGASIDTCNKKIAISWNSYLSVPVKVSGYSVLLSVDGGSYSEVSNVGSDIKSFTLSDFKINADYCFVIRANLEDGTSSTSNKTCISTKMQKPPLWINADKATVSIDNIISLSFTIDPFSEITHFRLERKKGMSGTFQSIAQPVSVNGSVLYTDISASKDTINFYRLSAINNCNIPVTYSNTASNMVLSLKRTGDDLILSWNGYKAWKGTISGYHLFVNTGKEFEEKRVVTASDTTITISYQELMYEVTGSQVCFYLRALETANPYGITGESQSSVACSAPTEIITVPNLFTPNNDLVNDYFRPVLSFTPINYHLIITDRQGNILFETTDYKAEWDGSRNGNHQSEGVYLWFLKVTTPSGKIVSKTGTVTIVNTR